MKYIGTDFLVIGSGVAGLSFAIWASKYGKVTLVTKDKIQESNTLYAQGGLAAAIGKDDSPEIHVQDTLRAGDGISNKTTAEILANDSPGLIDELIRLGVRFEKKNGKLKLSREAVHSRARIVYYSDITGEEIEKVLVKRAKENKNITILENHFAIDLIVKNNTCKGSRFINKNKETLNIFAKKTLLATGGLGRLYAQTTNPEIATGDGIAMAFRAGAILEDMEFVQFHPTMFYNPNLCFLISETLRGEGGILKNKYGKTYMKKYHRDGELAPRDVVSKFSVIEMKKNRSKNVFLDMTHLEENYLKKRFPRIYETCLKYGIDMTKDMIPVVPSAHYICGGIKTDLYGKTNITNLYATGECACTQLHGADRLASNSMIEGLVFSKRLIEKIKTEIKKENIKKIDIKQINLNTQLDPKVEKLKKQFQEIMWHHVGIIKNKKGLNLALEKIEKIKDRLDKIKEKGTNKEIIELSNMILLGKVIVISALRRKESRGTHFIQDYHERHDNIWQRHLVIDKKHPKFK